MGEILHFLRTPSNCDIPLHFQHGTELHETWPNHREVASVLQPYQKLFVYAETTEPKISDKSRRETTAVWGFGQEMKGLEIRDNNAHIPKCC